MKSATHRHARTLALALTCFSACAQAQDEGTFDDRWYVVPMASYVIADDARTSDDGYGAALALGKRVTAHFELELRGQYLRYDARDNRTSLLGVPIGQATEDVTLSSGGIGASWFPLQSGRGLFLHADAMGGDATLYNLGIGFDIGTEVALRLEALYHVDDDAHLEETQFNLGFRIPFGTLAEPVRPAPEPVRIVPAVTPPPPKAACADGIDNDGDGLVDYPDDPGCASARDDDEANPRCETPAAGAVVDFDGCAVGDSIVLRGVNFEFDKATLTANARTLLNQVGDALQRRGDIKVEVSGHTDDKGSDRYNQRLSERRAQAVVDYLVVRGVARDRMRAVGYGEARPVADNATDAGRELNRRVELEVLASGPSMVAPEVLAPMPAPMPTPSTAPTPSPMPSAEADSATPVPAMAPPLTPQATPAPTPTLSPAPTPTLPPAPAPTAPPAQAPSAAAASVSVVIANYAFSPERVTVAAGGSVTWTNQDRRTHIVQFNDGTSAEVAPGQSYTKDFAASGEYPYVCGIHGSMHGAVVVQ